MSTSSSTPQTAVQQLIEQRLDAIDRALLGLLPRQERLAAVAHVETRIKELVAANPAVAATVNAPPQGLSHPDSAFSNLAAESLALPPHLPLFGLAAGGQNRSTQKKRSRLALSAGVLGILALALLLATPVTYFTVAALGDVLGEVIAISLIGAHAAAVALGGVAAIGLGIAALVSLSRRREQLRGHGWAIAGLCTGPLPMLLGIVATLYVALELGVGQFVSVSGVPFACDSGYPAAADPAGSISGVAMSAATAASEALPLDASQPEFQPASHETPAAATRLSAVEAGHADPIPQTSPPLPPQPLPPQSGTAPRAEPQPQTETQPNDLEFPLGPGGMPESAPAISK